MIVSIVDKFRHYMWRILGIDQKHIQRVCDHHFLKEDKYSIKAIEELHIMKFKLEMNL